MSLAKSPGLTNSYGNIAVRGVARAPLVAWLGAKQAGAWVGPEDGGWIAFAEAAADARLALSYLDDALPSDAFSTLRADAWLALGRALLPQGHRDEGQAALRQALANLDSALGAEHPRTVEVRKMLVTQGA